MTEQTDAAEVSMGQWARDVADTYRTMAAEVEWPLRRAALTAEAAKYDGIAARMDRIPRAAVVAARGAEDGGDLPASTNEGGSK